MGFSQNSDLEMNVARPTDLEHGLSDREVAERRSLHGENVLAERERKSLFSIITTVLREPMLLLLLGSAVLYLFLGEFTEAILLFGSALVVVGINLVQDIRSERALEALRALTSPRAHVIRNGVSKRIAASEIVPGDVMLLSEGDRIVADAVLAEGWIEADESLITGESHPVEKIASTQLEFGLEESRLFSGALVVTGSGKALALRTGTRTEIGRIGESLARIESDRSALQRQTGRLVNYAAIFGIGICVVVAVLYQQQTNDWLAASLLGISLAMSLLPEEFPVILSVFLALGARRLSAAGTLVRRMAAVEELGAVTALCVDKTGTLTMNEMALVRLVTREGKQQELANHTALDVAFSQLLEIGNRATKPGGFDPMDRAVQKAHDAIEQSAPSGRAVHEFPLRADFPAFGELWKTTEDTFTLAVKGAPEWIAMLCHLSPIEQHQMHERVEQMAADGLRVLAVAVAESTVPMDAIERASLEYIGLLGFQDPLRPGVVNAVRQCHDAGIRVLMITGDHPVTARSIARAASIDNPEAVITGSMLDAMNVLELQERISSAAGADTVNVFARVTPSQKLLLVEALKQTGEVVAMTGDGVNDAPALKAANIGVAMGGRGTDVAREAAALVLTTDDFPSLVEAVRLGRRTYENIKKAMYFVLAMHVPIAGLSLIPILLGLPVIFFPIHIVLLELIIDPVSSIVFEAEPGEGGLMKHPPRSPQASLFRTRSLLIAGLQGLSVLAVCIAVYLLAYDRMTGVPGGDSELEARTLAFVTLILSALTLALVNRSWSRTFLATLRVPNRLLWIAVGIGMLVTVLITQLQHVREVFHFGPFHAHDWVICIGAALFSLTWFELLKLVLRRPLEI